MLKDKKIVMGITGSIAAYKAAEWVRELKREGCDVHVVMTTDACRFVTPLTFAALSGNKVHEGMFDPEDAESIPHISLAADADLILVGPKLDLTFTNTIFFTTFVQYNNQIDNINVNMRFQWRYARLRGEWLPSFPGSNSEDNRPSAPHGDRSC